MIRSLEHVEKVVPLHARISYCTCCFGRDWQLAPALAMNMWSQLPYLRSGSVRFVISLIEGTDKESKNQQTQTITLLKTWFSEEIRKGWLVVGLSGDEFFQSCRHKNRAHKLALLCGWGAEQLDEGPGLAGVFEEPYPKNHITHWLVNVDADNILPTSFPHEVLKELEKTCGTVRPKGVAGFRCCTGGTDSGVTGRVGLTAERFLMLGGYNEAFHPRMPGHGLVCTDQVAPVCVVL